LLLLSLAAEEKEHQKIFEKIQAADLSLSGEDSAELNVEDYTSVEDIPDDANTKEVITAAIDRENLAICFYSDLAKLGGNMRRVFNNLAEQEKKHKERLESFLKEHVLVWD